MRDALRRPAHLAATAIFLLPILACVVASRLTRRRDARPRLVWGPVPIISIKYWSQALRRRGFESTTIVYDVYSINARGDFDVVLDRGPLRALRPYTTFVRVLLRYDVVSFFFDGGFLAPTPLRSLECPLLRAAGMKIVLSPYGSDVAVAEFLGPFRDATIESTPHLIAREAAIRRRVDHFCRWGDFVVRNVQPGYLPRSDVLWPTCLAIDTDEWAPGDTPAGGDTVVVVHSANHPAIKGTALLERAIAELQEDGVPVELDLMVGVTNAEVKRRLRAGDVLAEQFLAGYGLAAIEGMSLAKPVLAHLAWMGDELLEQTALRECPIVDTPPERLADELRAIVADRRRRQRLSAEGRAYVLRHHSLDAVGRVWEQIFMHVWTGSPAPTTRSIAEAA
jgi:glycosyltransferase involved in cell wall biosynthesis